MAKTIILDVRGALLILKRKKGRHIFLNKTAFNYGLTVTTLQNYEKEAPKEIKMLYYLIKKYPNIDLSIFMDKDVHDSINFTINLLKDNPEITFNDLVKEV